MDLSVIIVNYKSPRLVLDCLHTLLPSTGLVQMEVIVVDNGSGDESEMLIRTAFPQVKWIQTGYNSGFARGNNAGIRVAEGRAILLLNSDTLNERNAVERCAERLLQSTAIAAGVQLLNPDRTSQISGNLFMKGGLNHLMSVPYLGRLIRAAGLSLKVKKTNVAQAEGEVQVDWINGAFLMVKKEAIEKAGLLDEDFFLYAEEIEWCSRLHKTGKMVIYGDLHVIHLVGMTASEAFGSSFRGYTELTDRKGLQLLVSGWLRIRKQFGVGWLLLHAAVYAAAIPVYFLAFLLSTLLFRPHRAAHWHSFASYTGNVCRSIALLPRMIRSKPYFYKML
ncbi:MAG: glycosyltransferase family 2 protein [Chitinophagaceae bacterium]|nr:glycosyltransferase family 2 protein [Chitinophagaceae bacterium]